MSKHILVTGATGMVGKQLVPALQALGHQVSILSRKQVDMAGVSCFIWDVEHQQIDKKAFDGIDTVIHLAGADIAEKKWTEERKKELIDSRVQSARLLYQTIRETHAPVTTFVSASAVGYYGDRKNEILTENCAPGEGFLADCCVKWEAAADEGLAMGIRVVKIRIGLILSKDRGILPALEKPLKYFVGAPLGSGRQWIPWVHLDDIVKLFVTAVENPAFEGAYNGCAPFPVTNKLLIKTLAGRLNRPVWGIHVPAFVIKAMMGEMSILALMSNNTMAKKLLDTGYKYAYTNLDAAIDSIYRPNHNRLKV